MFDRSQVVCARRDFVLIKRIGWGKALEREERAAESEELDGGLVEIGILDM